MNTNATSEAMANDINCYDDAEAHKPAVFMDCMSMIKNSLGQIEDQTTPLSWGRQCTLSDTEIRVPYLRYMGQCALMIDVPDREFREKTSVADVIWHMKEIAKACVIKAPLHLGGDNWIGWHGKMRVVILGRVPYGGDDLAAVDGGDDCPSVSGGWGVEDVLELF